MENNTGTWEEDWKRFRKTGDAVCFGRLVQAFTDLVFSTAHRVLNGDGGLAEDVTQTVFLLLARKGRSLAAEINPGSWCYRQAVRLATNTVRKETRRRHREQQYAAMNTSSLNPDDLWQSLAPVLDTAMSQLADSDREILLGRFFEKQDFHSLGRRVGISADAAQKRASRAMDRLRVLIHRRGFTTSTAVLAMVMMSHGVQAAPNLLAMKAATAATPAIPAGLWPTVMAVWGTRAALAGAGLAAILAMSVWWQLHGSALTVEAQNAANAARLSVLTRASAISNVDSANGNHRLTKELSLAEILQQLEATLRLPASLSTTKRTEWLLSKISDESLREAALWVTDPREVRVRESLFPLIMQRWMKHFPEDCANFCVDELPLRIVDTEWAYVRNWVETMGDCFVTSALGMDRVDEWLTARCRGEPGEQFMNSEAGQIFGACILRPRFFKDLPRFTKILEFIPAGSARRKFILSSCMDSHGVGWNLNYHNTVGDVLNAIAAMADPSLRSEALPAVLASAVRHHPIQVIDWWKGLPSAEQRRHLLPDLISKSVLWTAVAGGAELHLDQVKELLADVPQEERRPLLIKLAGDTPITTGLEKVTTTADADSLRIIRLRFGTDYASPSAAADHLRSVTNIDDPTLRASLLRGFYRRWCQESAADATAFLESSDWPEETKNMLLESAQVP